MVQHNATVGQLDPAPPVSNRGDKATGFVMLIGILFIYFLPAYIARRRNHPSRAGIFLANLFFGWTIIGYLLVLIWAASAPKAPARAIRATRNHLTVGDTKVCPDCAETIKAQANVCRFCGHKFNA